MRSIFYIPRDINMDNYRGYRISYGRVWKDGTDGFKVCKGFKYITGVGTNRKARLDNKYWEFWKKQAMLAVDKLIGKEKE